MAIKLESAQLLLYRAAAHADNGLPSAYRNGNRQSGVRNLTRLRSGEQRRCEIMGLMGFYARDASLNIACLACTAPAG